MKKMSKTFVGILIASVIAVGFSTSAFAENTTGITVNGTGSVLADPDTSVITASIETIENTAETAKSLNNSLCSDLRNSMVAAGISEDKIVTEYTYVSPERKYDEKTDEYGNILILKDSSIISKLSAIPDLLKRGSSR